MKAKPQDIELEDLNKWLQYEEVTYASSSLERKRLVFQFNGMIKVLVGGKLVWHGTIPKDAVEAYNKITEKFVDDLKDFRI